MRASVVTLLIAGCAAFACNDGAAEQEQPADRAGPAASPAGGTVTDASAPSTPVDAGALPDGGGRPPGASSPPPPGTGWHVLPGTKIRPLCPPNVELKASTGCTSVVIAWSGAIADTKRNQLVIWGGGHNDWYGNEVYALDLGTKAMARITEPSPVDNVQSCPEAYIDGRPSSRHTYGGLTYVADMDAMFAFGGSRSSCGGLGNSVWMLDLNTLTWTLKYSTTPAVTSAGAITDYDPVTKKVFLQLYYSVHAIDPKTTGWTEGYSNFIDYHLSGAIDPVRRRFFLFGNGTAYSIDISGNDPKYTTNPIAAPGCDFKNAGSPGVAYDSKRGVLVGWSGGGTVYTFNPVTLSCTSQTYPDGPGAAPEQGTFGRFRYFPALDVYALVNSIDEDAYVLRIP